MDACCCELEQFLTASNNKSCEWHASFWKNLIVHHYYRFHSWSAFDVPLTISHIFLTCAKRFMYFSPNSRQPNTPSYLLPVGTLTTIADCMNHYAFPLSTIHYCLIYLNFCFLRLNCKCCLIILYCYGKTST